MRPPVMADGAEQGQAEEGFPSGLFDDWPSQTTQGADDQEPAEHQPYHRRHPEEGGCHRAWVGRSPTPPSGGRPNTVRDDPTIESDGAHRVEGDPGFGGGVP